MQVAEKRLFRGEKYHAFTCPKKNNPLCFEKI